jgi:hypothetical protein
VEEEAEERVNNSVKRTEREKIENVKSRNRPRTDGDGGRGGRGADEEV